MLNITQKKISDVLVITPYGKVHHDLYEDFSNKLNEALVFYETNRVVLDFGSVTYMSSSGFRVLLLLNQRLLRAGGKLVLCNIRVGMMNVFRVTGFVNVFNISPNIDEAICEVKKARVMSISDNKKFVS